MKLNSQKVRRIFLILSWALYDLANQFFAVNVISLFFPRWLIIQKDSPEIFYSISFGISMFFVAICAPILGVISDRIERHKTFLIYFTLLSVVFTINLSLFSNLFLVLIFFAIANFGCQTAVVFYNALLVNVAPLERIGFVSGLGRMLGYSGAFLAVIFSKPIILKFGYQATFFLTGMLFLIFSLPCMIFIKDKPPKQRLSLIYFLKREKILEIFQRLKKTLFDNYEFKEFRNLLKAAFFGLCAVNTVIVFMSVYISKGFGLNEVESIDLFVFGAIFALIGSIVFGYISDIVGCRRSLLGIFLLWGMCFLGGGLLKPPFHWLIGALAGVSLGASWVVFRALAIKLIPPEKIGEAFGLFNLLGQLAAVVGPLFWGIMLLYFSSFGEWGYRVTLLSLIIFIATGFVFLLRLPKQAELHK